MIHLIHCFHWILMIHLHHSILRFHDDPEVREL
jgi:hypothetical protein